MYDKYARELIQEKVNEKVNVKLKEIYDKVWIYILLVAICICFAALFIQLPMHYYLYFSWHFIWILVGMLFYEKINIKPRTYLILAKFFIGGIFMFYLEDYTLFAVFDIFIFIVIVGFNIKEKYSYIFGIIIYLLMLFKVYLVYEGYIQSRIEQIYDWYTTYVVILVWIIFFFVVHNYIKKFLFANLFAFEENMIELNKLAYYDRLTGIRNREYFKRRVNILIEKGMNNKCIAMFNIRNIRSINLAYGTKMGDTLLKEIARILDGETKTDEIVARTSGNEFCMLIDKDIEVDRIVKIYEKLKSDFHVENLDTEIEYYVACADYEEEFFNVDEWLQKVIITVTHLKTNKIDSIGYYKKELGNSVLKKEKLYDELRKEIENSGFHLFYQCKVDASNGKIIGAEALARWESKSFGRVSPYEFIPMIERLSLSNDFGDIIVNKAISEYSDLEKKYGKGISLSINISPSHLLSAKFKENIMRVLKEYGVSAENIILEVTENVMIESMDIVNAVFDGLREEGFKISLDDFGTGYSSLNYLFGLSIDELKIDKSFVDSLAISKRSEELLNFLIDLSNMYNLDIVCEGVETDEQCEKLLKLGCPIIQGYYFSKPLPISEH